MDIVKKSFFSEVFFMFYSVELGSKSQIPLST